MIRDLLRTAGGQFAAAVVTGLLAAGILNEVLNAVAML